MLPQELKYKIALEVDPSTLKKLCKTDSDYYAICNDTRFWKEKSKRDFNREFSGAKQYFEEFHRSKAMTIEQVSKIKEEHLLIALLDDTKFAQASFSNASRLRHYRHDLHKFWEDLIREGNPDQIRLFLDSFILSNKDIDKAINKEPVIEWVYDHLDPKQNMFAKELYNEPLGYHYRQWKDLMKGQGTENDYYVYKLLRHLIESEKNGALITLIDKMKLRYNKATFDILMDTYVNKKIVPLLRRGIRQDTSL